MMTRQMVSDHIIHYLNHEITLAQLVDWAENCLVEGGFHPDEDVDLLMDIVMYLAGGDTGLFPLDWNICVEFLEKLGVNVKVVYAETA